MSDKKILGTICFNQELGELLFFTSKIATAIRMNSPYSSEYNKVVSGLKQFGFGVRADIDEKFNEHAYDVMNMSDSLEQLDQFSHAITCHDLGQIDQACSSIITMYTQCMIHPDTAKTFHRWDGTDRQSRRHPQFSLQEVIDILQKIKTKIHNHNA